MGDDGADTDLDIGARVRSRRAAAGWSMRELAARAGVSQPYVSKLEAGLIRPSVATLYALAAAFGTSPAQLLPPAGSDGAGVLHLPLGEGAAGEAQVVAGGPGDRMQVYRFALEPGEGDPAPFRHGGEEVVYVVEGEVTARRDGLPDVAVAAGSALTIDPLVPHSWHNGGVATARFLLICADQG